MKQRTTIELKVKFDLVQKVNDNTTHTGLTAEQSENKNQIELAIFEALILLRKEGISIENVTINF